jgi:hypothetical protein
VVRRVGGLRLVPPSRPHPTRQLLLEAELLAAPLGVNCHECVRADPADYLRYVEGRETSAATIDLDLKDHGYLLVQDGFEHGFYDGQDADPRRVAEALRRQDIRRFIFKLDRTGQFDCEFSVYVHQDEIEKFDRNRFEAAETDGPSVADGLRRALADASHKMAGLPDAKIKLATCDVSWGTANVRAVTPQEFVGGL